MKREPTAASGRCLIPAVATQNTADDILAKHKISTVSATPGERLSLARGLAQAQALLGKDVVFAKNVQFQFETRSGYSFYQGGKNVHYIHMNRCDSKGKNCAANNTAHLMHELGHRIGHASYSGGRSFYEAYNDLGMSCHPTRYSKANKREEFAEVFSAFLTHPELLSQGNAGCKRAFNFFTKDVFAKNGELASCDRKIKEELMARANVPSETQVAVAEPIPPVAVPVAKPVRSQRPPLSEALVQPAVDKTPSVSSWLFDTSPIQNADWQDDANEEPQDRARDRDQSAWLWGSK